MQKLTHNSNDEEFESKLDENKYLIGFENGVYDLKKHKFRDGKPEDYISMSVGYNYVDSYSEQKEDLVDFLEEIQPNKKDREFLLRFVSTGLNGETKEQLVVFLTEKMQININKLKDLICYALGEYAITFASSLMTKRTALSLQLDLLAFNHKRFAFGIGRVSEKINTHFFRYFLEGDTIPCLDAYNAKYTTFKPTHKMMILCNNKITFNNCNDTTIKKGVRHVVFPTKIENKRIIQKKILSTWKQDFMLLLIEKYKQYEKSGLNK